MLHTGAESSPRGHIEGQVNHFENQANESRENDEQFSELKFSGVPLAKHVYGLTVEQKHIIERDVLNAHNLTELFFDDEQVNADLVISKLNELFSEPSAEVRRFIAKTIADALNV